MSITELICMATNLEPALEQRLQHALDSSLVAVLSMTAGAVDAIGFLGLGGLFIAHITGNIVVVVAHYITGGFSRIGPLIAVPVFIVVLGTVVWVSKDKSKHRTLRALLILHAALLTGFLVLSAALGPFANPGSAVRGVGGHARSCGDGHSKCARQTRSAGLPCNCGTHHEYCPVDNRSCDSGTRYGPASGKGPSPTQHPDDVCSFRGFYRRLYGGRTA